MDHVIGILREEAGCFRLSLPDFPGLVTEGATLAAAVGRASEEVAGRLRTGEGRAAAIGSMEALVAKAPEGLDAAIAVLVPVPLQADPPRQRGTIGGELPGNVPPAVGQVPLSGRVSATEVPSERAKAKAEAETAGTDRPLAGR